MHGLLIRRHGLYTWGRDLDELKRHLEVLEFLLEVVGRSRDGDGGQTMAVVRIPGRGSDGHGRGRGARGRWPRVGIDYERWQPAHPVPDGAPAEEVLAAYASEIERLKKSGGYVTADVIDVTPQTPNLDAMLAKFRREHWHDEDEVRFILRGRGVFHIHPEGRAGAGHRGRARRPHPGARAAPSTGSTCARSANIRAIRLFQDVVGLDAALHGHAAWTRATSRSAWARRTFPRRA